MKKNEKNKVILGQDDSLEPRTSAESKKESALSLRGAVGDVAISCDKALSSRGRAESSDVVISCDKVLMNIRNHYCMSLLFSKIATSAFRLLGMTASTLTIVAVLSTFYVLLPFSFSGIVGLLFGFFPAYKASLLNPINALRYE